MRERPANAQDVPHWELRGTYDDAIRIPAVGWDFRATNGFIEGLIVFSRGEFRPDVGHLYFPRPFTNDLALLPQSRWGLLPNGGESKLGYAATPSNSLLVTWVNGLLDRNPLTPTNFQAEFFPNGSYEYRYPDHSEPHPFVLPFDWDGDGLENTVDPEPETAGPDAHNTNGEWHNVVCTNIVSAVEGTNGVDFLWKDGVNSNAYYFAEVVVPRGPVPVYFNASQPGRLGSPAVVALKDVTNRVPLHIGVSYAVTSDVPFSISAPDAGFAEVERRGPCSCDIVWPLRFELASTDQEGVYHVEVLPYDPGGGTFTWSIGSGHGGGPSLMDASPQESCACIVGSGSSVTFNCTDNCGCEGVCRAHGTYLNESLSFSFDVGGCGCRTDSYHPDPLVPSFSASVGSGAVIYEDAYVDSPGHTVSKRSTRTFVSVSASGGPNGGSFTLTTENLGKLEPLSRCRVEAPNTSRLSALSNPAASLPTILALLVPPMTSQEGLWGVQCG